MALCNLLNISAKRQLSTAPSKQLDFFYDVISPYSWFSFEVLMRYKKHWNIDINLQPVLLGGIFKDSGNASPMTLSPLKTQHLPSDIVRCAKYYEVPLIPMKSMTDLLTLGSIPPMRFLTALKFNFPQSLEEATRQFWMIRWNKDKDITTPEAMEEVGEKCGFSKADRDLIFELCTSNEVKEQLRKTTQYAVECGAFGVPTVLVVINGKKEIFFGADRLPILAQEIGEVWKGPNPDKTSKL